MLCSFFLFFALPVFSSFGPQEPELKDYKYPSKVYYREIPFRGETLRMAYMDEGPVKPNGETVVLLHGKNFSGNYWQKTSDDLELQGYRVIIPDQIGFGKSSKPDAFPFSFQALAQHTVDLLNEKKVQKFILVGHSMGGMLATRLALMYPEKVSKLILVNPIGLEDWKTMVPYKPVMDLYQAELKTTPESIRSYQKESYFDGKWSAEAEKGIEILAGWTLHPQYAKIAWNAALTTEMIFTQPVVYEFKHLSMPTLLLVGTRDRTAVGKGWAPEKIRADLGRYDLLGKKVIKDIPKGKLVELPGVGHMPQVEAYPEYIKAIKDFMKE